MTSALDVVALMLPPDDREVVLGDLEEQGIPGWLGIVTIIGFVIRQQAEFWRARHAWIIAGAVIPATFLLLGFSFRLSLDFRDLPHASGFLMPLVDRAVLMIAWAWAGGFVLGSLSRRTGWVSPLLFALPCLSCLITFDQPSINALCLLLFVPPGLVGAVLGQRWRRMGIGPSLVLSAVTVGGMLLWRAMPIPYWLLLLPILYLTSVAARPQELEKGVPQ